MTTHTTDPVSGHVGGVVAPCKMRLKDVPEMGYHCTDNPPRGQICIKGQNVFSGYFRNREMSKAAFDEEGWLMTGDVGVVFPNGSVKIIDRAKNIFKLA
jgi:long-chain acyl-CoA synthetase